ncbi:hypothetical protein CMK11_12380 [Candidatus Poribacteria bacterium]|nr:hypothetical protein [Candidatus Poribacteria bacterium]
MKLTPLDIYQKEFRRKTLNGLDPEDVEQFLFQVAEGLEALLHENARLTQRLASGGPEPAGEGTDVGEAPTPPEGRQEVDQARQEARRIGDEARAKGKALVDDARAEAQRILDAAQARASQPATHSSTQAPRPDARARQFAREYQAMIVKHLAQVTHHLADEDDHQDDPVVEEPAATDEDRTTEVGTRA